MNEKTVVECYSGVEYAERPTAFEWEGQRLVVESVEARWRTPEGKGFRVRTQEGQAFELVHLEAEDQWAVRPI